MTPKQAKKIADKVKDAHFGLLMENGNGVWIYECKTEKHFGTDCHLKRYRGCFWKHFDGDNEHLKITCSPNRFKYKGFMLDSELYRTDWKVTIISEAVLDAILAK